LIRIALLLRATSRERGAWQAHRPPCPTQAHHLDRRPAEDALG